MQTDVSGAVDEPADAAAGAEAAGPEHKATGARGRRVQVRRQRATGWTKARRAVFLDRLAVTCNVTISARAAGIAPANAHALKRRDPTFAALWAAALEAGYEHIEAQLLARAIGANPADLGESPDADALAEASTDGFDPALAMKVLGLRQPRGTGRVRGPVGKRVPIEQVRAILEVKLAALRRRLEAQASAATTPQDAGSVGAGGGTGAA